MSLAWLLLRCGSLQHVSILELGFDSRPSRYSGALASASAPASLRLGMDRRVQDSGGGAGLRSRRCFSSVTVAMGPAQLRMHRVKRSKSRKSQRCRPLAGARKDVDAHSWYPLIYTHIWIVSGPRCPCVCPRTHQGFPFCGITTAVKPNVSMFVSWLASIVAAEDEESSPRANEMSHPRALTDMFKPKEPQCRPSRSQPTYLQCRSSRSPSATLLPFERDVHSGCFDHPPMATGQG
jgi:hypothetical protein